MRTTNILRNQHGAMFSMDARIALVVASILAVSLGGMQMSRIERTKVENTDVAAELITKGIETYYISTGITTVPTSWANVQTLVFDTGLVENQTLNADAWGSAWVYDTCTETNVSIDGIVVPSVQYFAIYSPGKDGTNDSGTGDFLTNGSCAADYGAWQPANDDIGRKFSTLDIEKSRVKVFRRQGEEITKALSAYEARLFTENQNYCSNKLALFMAGNAAQDPANDDRCDWMDVQDVNQANPNYINSSSRADDNTYDIGEEGRANYYPRSSLENQNLDVYYVPDLRTAASLGVQATYDVGAAASATNSMEALMELLSLPRTYAVDPWNRRLRYNSNVTNVGQAPFTTSIEFCTTPTNPATCG
ncbi:MAG: hypothetical protein GC134_08880 [Proteobacteria bacterium]|nr:hypothetical protein [Pseudomonadota bacterium]